MSTVTKPILKDETGVRIAQAIEDLQAIGRPTYEQVELAVGEYLEDHPEMTTTVEDGSLTEVKFTDALKMKKASFYDSVEDMIADTGLIEGMTAVTTGYYAENDGGGCIYTISDSHTGYYYKTLANGLYANMEDGIWVNAKQIGLKAYGSKSAAEADTTGMENNQTILEDAIENGSYVYIPEGIYAFDDKISCHNQSLHIKGAGRQKTVLYFPSSGGLYLNDNDYYNYPYIGHVQIESKGKCFECTSNVKSVQCGRFEYLWLKSIDDECFVAPPENLGSLPVGTSFDTCMWGNDFYYIHGQSENGAVFANLSGSGNRWRRYNSYSSKYAFRNCTGIIESYYSLGTTLDHFLYYDDMIIHSGNLTLINAVAETVKKSFIYVEDDTQDNFTISTLYCVDSGATYDPTATGRLEPPIYAGRINNFYVWGTHSPFPTDGITQPIWDESVVAPIYVKNGPIRSYSGLPHGIKLRVTNGAGMLYTLSTPQNTAVAVASDSLYQKWAYPTEDVLSADRLFGGRKHQTLNVDATTLTGYSFEIPAAYNNCDIINVTVESTDTYKRFNAINSDANVIGRQIVLINNANSTNNFKLKGGPTFASMDKFGFYAPDLSDLELVPGEAAFLILDNITDNGSSKLAWRRINYNESVSKYDYTFANGNGVVLTSGDGTKYRLVVANDGTLSTELVT